MALGVDEHRPVGQPVADLKRRVAQRPGQLPTDCVRADLAELDDQVGDRRPLPRGDQETRQQAAGKDAQRHLVHEQRRTADLLRRQQQTSCRGSRKHQAQPGSGLQRDQAGPSGPANRPNILACADRHQQRGQQDGGGLALPDR